jgi:hypothetical protein
MLLGNPVPFIVNICPVPLAGEILFIVGNATI